MIEVVKGVEPTTGYGPILALSEMEAEMREHAREADEDGVYVLRRGLQRSTCGRATGTS